MAGRRTSAAEQFHSLPVDGFSRSLGPKPVDGLVDKPGETANSERQQKLRVHLRLPPPLSRSAVSVAGAEGITNDTILRRKRTLTEPGDERQQLSLAALAVSPDGRHCAVAGREVLRVYSLVPSLSDFVATTENDNTDGDSQNVPGGAVHGLAGFSSSSGGASSRKSGYIGPVALGVSSPPLGTLVEVANLRGKQANLNFSSNDVQWHPSPQHAHMLATAAPNGAVCVWNLGMNRASKLEQVITDHRRTVNRVCWHPEHPYTLLSCSQDGDMVLWDIREWKNQSKRFVGRADAVRDVKFSHSYPNYFAAGCDNGQVHVWDIRFNKSTKARIFAHDGPVFCVDWHPTHPNLVASGGRDKHIKVWDLETNTAKHTVKTIASVSRVCWRPASAKSFSHRMEVIRSGALASYEETSHGSHALSSDEGGNTTSGDEIRTRSDASDGLLAADLNEADAEWASWTEDYSRGSAYHIAAVYSHDPQVHVWDVESPYVPHLRLVGRRDGATTDLTWLSPDEALTVGKDGTVRLDHMHGTNVIHPQEFLSTAGTSWRPCGTSMAFVSQPIDRTVPGRSAYERQLKRSTLAEVLGDSSNLSPPAFPPRKEAQVGTFRRYDSKTAPHLVHLSSLRDGRLSTDDPELPHHAFVFLARSYVLTPANGTTLAVLCEKNAEAAMHAGQPGISELWDFIKVFWGAPAWSPRPVFERGGTTSTTFAAGSEKPSRRPQPKLTSRRDGTSRLPTLLEAVSARPPPEQIVSGVEDSDNSSEGGNREGTAARGEIMGSNHEWEPGEFLRITLHQMVEMGDVQTPAVAAVALGTELWVGSEENGQTTTRRWLAAYIQRLQRAELYREVTSIMTVSPDSQIFKQNQKLTTLHTSCDSCGKPLNRSGYACVNCKRRTSPCSVCHQPCKGLFSHCQGCGHSSHLKCAREWFRQSRLCPTGCLHTCTY